MAEWLPKYNYKDTLISDISAGLTVFVFLIPQGMAYALLAGMPPIYGLYSSIVPLFVYAVLGTSQQLSLGPMAITSLLLNVGAHDSGYDEQSDPYIKVVMNLSLLVGLCIFFMGLFRLGALINLISESVLTGFLTASALVIALNQIKYILGMHVPRFTYTYQTIIYILSHLDKVNGNAIGVGFATMIVLLGVRWYKKNYKATPERSKDPVFKAMQIACKMSNFICIVFGSIIAYLIINGGQSIDIVGEVPSGLKNPGFDGLPIPQLFKLVPSALAVSFVAFAGNWAVAKKYAAERGYEVDATQEMLAEGMAVFVGVFFNSFAGSGGLARSAVNAESGAVTQLSAILVAVLMLFAVQFMTALFYYIPMCVLGAVIEISVISMLDFEAMIKAYTVHRYDCLVMVSTFMLTFFVGVSEGLFCGIFISIAVIVHTTAFPTIVHEGQLPENEGGHFKDINRFHDARQIPGVAIIRMDATIFFGNCAHFKDIALRAAAGEFHTSDTPVQKLIIDASCWIDIDLAGVNALFDLKAQLVDKKGMSLAIVGAKGKVRDKLRDSQFYKGQIKHFKYFSVQDALDDVDRTDPLVSSPEWTCLVHTVEGDEQMNPLQRGAKLDIPPSKSLFGSMARAVPAALSGFQRRGDIESNPMQMTAAAADNSEFDDPPTGKYIFNTKCYKTNYYYFLLHVLYQVTMRMKTLSCLTAATDLSSLPHTMDSRHSPPRTKEVPSVGTSVARKLNISQL